MKNKNLSKIALSLLIALAFIMPMNAMADGGGEAGDVQLYEANIDNVLGPKPKPYITESTLQNMTVCIEDINLSAAMPVDCYDINITVSNTNITPFAVFDCDIKVFMDIFKQEDIPKEEIICFDFEDTGDIYNYWDSIDDTTDSTSGPGGIDTWTRSDVRSVSPSYSFHNSQFDDHYMGNQLDYLMATIPIPEDYDELIVEFCSWVEGEHIYDGDGNEILHDYGWVEYSFDGSTWTAFGDYYYNETEWNCSKEYTITGASGQSTLYWRFAWTSGPICQNEGWFIDDVCFYGREAPTLGNLVFTTHSLSEFTVPGLDEIYYEFPETWCPDEGNYTIRIWMLSETTECEVCYPQNDPYMFNVTIGDVMDIAVTHNQILHPLGSTFTCEEDLLVNGTVCNEGTLDAYDLPVTFSISRQIKQIPFDDLVEGAYYPDDYVPYSFENPDNTFVQAVNFGTVEDPEFSQSGYWHIDDVDSISPTHSWFLAGDDDHYGAELYDAICWTFDGFGVGDWNDLVDATDVDMTAMINFKIDPGDGIFLVIPFGNTWTSFGYSRTGYFEPTFGSDTGGWVPMSFRDLLVAAIPLYEANPGYPDDFGEYGSNPIGQFLAVFAEDTGNDPEGIGIMICNDGRSSPYSIGLPTGDWSGIKLDNVKFEITEIGDEIYSEVIIIDELLVGECVEVEFMWDNIPTGDFIECKSVPDDDNNDNNELCNPFSVKILWDEANEIDVESQDLTLGYDCHWHVVTSGYNQYLWAGEDEPCTYGDDYNDILLFAPEGEECMDWTGGSPIVLELDEWSEMEQGFDYVYMEVYPYCDDIGYQWYQYSPTITTIAHEDFETPPVGTGPPQLIPWSDYLTAPGWTVTDNIGGQGWLQTLYAGFTGNAFIPGWYMGEPQWTPGQFANSSTWNWVAPVDESLWYGPMDWTVFPSNSLDWMATYLQSPASTALEVNIWSGVWPPANLEGQFADYYAHSQANGYPGYIIGEPYLSSYGVMDSQHTTLVDPNNVYVEFKHQSGLAWAVESFNIDDMLWEGSQLPQPGVTDHEWQHTMYSFTPDLFINPLTGNDFLTEIGAFTDEMQFRFRFVSDGGTHYRGYMIDNVEIYDGGTIMELDECDTMDNFICDTVVGGDFWYYNSTYGGWQCMDQIADLLPNDLDNDDLDVNDYCYLEFSTDGGSSWVAPVRYSGAASGDAVIDMSAFTGDNVLIRWRVDTNATDNSWFYRVQNMTIYADIDTEPPVTTGLISGTVIHGWYSSPVTFTATAVDDYSGVDAIYYKIDGGSTLTYSAPITLSVNGEHFIEYWAVDNVGNEEIHHITPTFQIDTGAAPSVSITAPGDGLYLFGNQLLSLSGRTIIIGGFTVDASASDADSGIFRVQFALDGTIFGEDTTSPFSAYCGEKHTGAGTITVTAEDFTGNTASASKDITYFKFL